MDKKHVLPLRRELVRTLSQNGHHPLVSLYSSTGRSVVVDSSVGSTRVGAVLGCPV